MRLKTIITNTEKLKMIVKTENFNPEIDIKLICTCGHEKCNKRSVSQELLNRVQKVRDDAARSLTVTSGGRCSFHPKEISRSKPADHRKGLGIDISVAGGAQRDQLVRLAIKHGFNAIGIAKTFVHLGYRPNQAPVMWVY